MLFIVNPNAGNGHALKAINQIETVCNSLNIDYNITLTKYPEHATEIAAENKNNYRKIIAVGGDGTVNEVLNGIVGGRASLGILPCGTGNDFAKTIYKTSDIDKIINILIKSDSKKCDIGKCNDKYFINIASVGLDAEVAHKVQRSKKLIKGKFSYLYSLSSTLLNYKPIAFKITIDDINMEEPTLLTTISNGKYYGGGIMPTPYANIFDGNFDICHIRKLNKFKIPFILNKYIKGKHENIKEVSFFKGKNITIQSAHPFATNIDGEIFISNKVRFSLKENYINLIHP